MYVAFKLPSVLRIWLETIPPISGKFKCDGCTGVFDNWFGIDLFPACELHDWLYHLARMGILDSSERKPADRVLRWHTYHQLCRGNIYGPAPKWYAWYFSSRRYYAVRLLGRKAFEREV